MDPDQFGSVLIQTVAWYCRYAVREIVWTILALPDPGSILAQLDPAWHPVVSAKVLVPA
jgi:hypothetical protein